MPDPDLLEVLDVNQTALDITLLTALLNELEPDTPFARWIEYRAYNELVQLLRNAEQLPADYQMLSPDERELHDWLLSGKGLGRRFSEETLRLFKQLQENGSRIIDEICLLYCEYKRAAAGAMGAATLALKVKFIAAAIVAAGGGFLFVGGLPITAIIAFLLSTGVLDKACVCDKGASPST